MTCEPTTTPKRRRGGRRALPPAIKEKRTLVGPPMAFTIQTFAKAHGFSVPFYYVLKSRGLGPAEMRLGSRVLITHESAATWRKQREAETAAEGK